VIVSPVPSANIHKSETLTFRDDAGASRSTWIATALAIAMSGWMASGYVIPSGGDGGPGPASTRSDPVSVAVEISRAEPVRLLFKAEGQAQPDRDTPVRTEMAGTVARVLISEGAEIADGDVIAQLSDTRARADLDRALEERARAQREFDNATTLRERGVATADRVSEARATLASAKAAVTNAREAIESLDIKAPFAGRLETLSLDAGEFVQAGAEVGRIIDTHPLTVAIEVPQQELGRIRRGQAATVTFITGDSREGEVSFVGTSASPETRTFLTKIRVQNADGSIPAGMSAEIRIPVGTVDAHRVTPSTISLNPGGQLGIKAVTEDDTVAFHPIEIVRAETDGL